MRSMSRRIWTAVAGLPPCRRFTLDRRAQNLRKRSRLPDGVGLYVQQRAAPVAPNPRQTDSEQPSERGQYWSFPLSPKGSELQQECSVLDCNGLVTAQQKSNESNHRQKEDWHVAFIVRPHPLSGQLVTGGRNNAE